MSAALQAEWIKARTLRSTWWNIALTLVLSIGLSALICLGLAVAGDSSEDESVQADALDITLVGYNLGTIVVMVLGIMLVTGEYTNAVVRTTFTAEPRRIRVFVAKALVLAAIAAVAGLVVAFGSFVIGRAILETGGLTASLSTAGAWRALFGVSLFFIGAAVFAFVIAALVRNTALSITIVVVLYLVLPPLTGLIPRWGDDIIRALPLTSGALITGSGEPNPGELGPWQGYAVLWLWIAVLAGIAAFLLRRRDA